MSTLPSNASAALPPLVPASVDEGVDPEIDYDALVTEDHKPEDRIFVEKQYRLWTEPLYASWRGPGEGRLFLVLVNVGWFYKRKTPAVVPDCLLSLDVTCPQDLQVKQGHSYYQWDMGKPPDVIIEAVSDRLGGEESFKKNLYARQGIPYYAVFDPKHLLSDDTLRSYERVGSAYRLGEAGPWPTIGLGLRLWRGKFEGIEETWLRWCEADGEIIPTGEERARQADARAAQADDRAARLVESVRQLDERTSQQDERARQQEERIRQLEEELRRLKGETPT